MNYLNYFPQYYQNYQYIPKLYPQIYDQQFLRNCLTPQQFPQFPQQLPYDLPALFLPQQQDQKQPGLGAIDPQILLQLKAYQDLKLRNQQFLPQSQTVRKLSQQNESPSPQHENESNQNKSKTRSRRLAHQIERLFACPISECKKSYGSEGSLGQHIKLKHPSYYASFNFSSSNKSKVQDPASANLESKALSEKKEIIGRKDSLTQPTENKEQEVNQQQQQQQQQQQNI